MTPRGQQADKPLWLTYEIVPLLCYIKFTEAVELGYALAAAAEFDSKLRLSANILGSGQIR
jgi:hypothetical protein